MRYDPKTILRNNIQRCFDKHPTIKSPTLLAKHCFWPRGKKKGRRIAARTIGYIFELGTDAPSPTLDVIEAVAAAFGLEIWELLTDSAQARRSIIEKILTMEAAPDSHLSNAWSATTIHQARAAYVAPVKAKKRTPQ